MFFFAYKIYRMNKKQIHVFKSAPKGYLNSLSSGLLLGFSSPSKILGYAVLFSAMGAFQELNGLFQKIPLIVGVGFGNLSWWLVFSLLISKKLNYLTPKRTRALQKISAFTSLANWTYSMIKLV